MKRVRQFMRDVLALFGEGRPALFVALAAASALGLLLAARSWLEARDARTRLAATLSAQQQLIAAAEQRERQRAQQLSDALDEIAKLKRNVVTPAEVLRQLPQYLPLPQPITIRPPVGAPGGSSPAGFEQGSAPPAGSQQGTASPSKGQQQSAAAQVSPPVAELPLEDLKPLFDFVQDCRACKAQLGAAQADRADDQVKLAALARERDAALAAARGGGFWARLRRNAKWFVIGGAVGAAVGAAAR